MTSLDQRQRALLGGAALLLLLSALPLFAGSRRSEAWARSQYASAERMRELLDERPSSERTRRDYQRVLSAYRGVYYGAPTSTKADPSVAAVAELLVEMGERFADHGILRAAIVQYQFLCREYPGSAARFDALLTIGRIYQDDLDDPSHARRAFEEFVRRYPRHHLVEEARKALAGEEQHTALKFKSGRDSPAKEEESGSAAGKAASEKGLEAAAGSQDDRLPRITGIRHWTTPDYTRIAIDLDREVDFESQRIDHPDRIFFDLPETKLASRLLGKTFDVDDGLLKKIRAAQFQPERTRIVLEVDELSDCDAYLLANPWRLIINIHGKNLSQNGHGLQPEASFAPSDPSTSTDGAEPAKAMMGPLLAGSDATADREEPKASRRAQAEGGRPPKATAAAGGVQKKIVEVDDDDDVAVARPSPPAARRVGKAAISQASDRSRVRVARSIREARPNASGDRSLIRALGLKIGKIVIDPGHGGHDTGTIGPGGFEEKDLVLDVSARLGKLLETRLGAEVDYTRRDDTFIPLETRTAIANQDQADLFVSIHANASRDPGARGVETYYLNFTSSPEALEVAARENAVSEESIHQLQDLVKKIALKEKIEESREFAADVQRSLHSGLAAKSPGIRNRGVKKAPFIVLIGANMPSILAEISFVSNPDDERRLRTPEYRQRIAESLYRGVARYVGGLSGVRVASKMDKSAGQ